MPNYDLVTCEDRVIVDVCDDSDEATRVRATRRKAGFFVFSVIKCAQGDFIEIKRSEEGKFAPKRIYQRQEECWVVMSVMGSRPAKLVLSDDEDDL